MFRTFVADYGMVFVLIGLCAILSLITIAEQHPEGESAADQLAEILPKRLNREAAVVIVARKTEKDRVFAKRLRKSLENSDIHVLAVVHGGPPDGRAALEKILLSGKQIDAVAAIHATSEWKIYDLEPTALGPHFVAQVGGVQALTLSSGPAASIAQILVASKAAKLNSISEVPNFSRDKVVTPPSYWWPNFLKPGNLLNIANQIAIIAVIAIGMTLVILTGGIDLSVGSLVALAAVTSTLFIRDFAGAKEATIIAMVCGGFVGIFVCAALGGISGCLVTIFDIPPFICTLAMMLVASGLAYLASEGQSISQIPDAFNWLGGQTTLGIPNAVLLMIGLYVLVHIIMTRMTIGRYIYAIGGNIEAARLSGVRVRYYVTLVYVISGALAGLGGVILASQLNSGSPKYGQMYELYVIAAVVVGGTSLAGGEGKVLGTLIGAFIIAVIQNGMNLLGVEPFSQKVVMGLVILGAVLIDRMKRRW